MKISYEMTKEEIIKAKCENKRVKTQAKYRSKKYFFIYILVSNIVLIPLFINAYYINPTINNGLKIAITCFFSIFLMTVSLYWIIKKFIDKKAVYEFNSMKKATDKEELESVFDISIELANFVKIKYKDEFRLSYSLVNSIIEEKKNLFIEYLDQELIFIPGKVFESQEEKYNFIKTFEDKHQLYKDKKTIDLCLDQFEKVISFKIGKDDIKNIAKELKGTLAEKFVYQNTKRVHLIIKFVIAVSALHIGRYYQDLYVYLELALVLGISFYCYDKLYLPKILEKSMIDMIGKNVCCNEMQYIGIKYGEAYFFDNNKILIRDLNSYDNNYFEVKNGYLVQSFGLMRRIYIPYNAFKDNIEMKVVMDYLNGKTQQLKY